MPMIRSIVLEVLLLLWVCPATFALDLGRAWIEPESGTVNEEGNWTVHHEVGAMGIAVGGGLRIQFPHAWFVHPWGSDTVKKVQTEEPESPHYASVTTKREQVQDVRAWSSPIWVGFTKKEL